MKQKLIATGAVLLAVTVGAALAQDKGGKGGSKGPATPEWRYRLPTLRMAASSPRSSPNRRSHSAFTEAGILKRAGGHGQLCSDLPRSG